MTSVLGTILDPAADKALVGTLVITLTIQGLLPCELSFHEKELDPHAEASPAGHCHCWPGSATIPICVLHSIHITSTPGKHTTSP
jgi:hypothetical protein